MQIARHSLTLTRPFTTPNNKSKVNQLPPASHQRSGFNSSKLDIFSRALTEINNGNTREWPPLNEIKEKVQLFLHFLNLDGFHEKNEEERSTAFQEYLTENNITHLNVESLIEAWNAYTKQLKQNVWDTSQFITEWNYILERIQTMQPE
jgi:hypothetical protein